jgi:carbamoyl-phosphate synthase small subunit
MKNGELILEDGKRIEGVSFGAETSIAGEVVFNTGMVGYPEMLTDPSYKGQILVMTFPLVGNYGVPRNKEEHGVSSVFESEKIQIAGLIVSNYSKEYFHHEAEQSLSEWLEKNNIPALYAVDTRALTKHLRKKGVMLGKVQVGKKRVQFKDPNKRHLAAEVGVKEPVEYGSVGKKMILVDAGIKNSTIRAFLDRGLMVKRVPLDYDFTEEECDALFISNGPGDPKQCKKLISHMKKFMKRNIPIMGICLGSQILARAAGADTYKLKYGHRSQNQPCILEGTQKCYITTQNHGYAVKEETLPKDFDIWFRNANDNTVEGIKHKKKPFAAVQFHPEANAGPVDTEWIFDEFVSMMK